jgi:hypothetical protein
MAIIGTLLDSSDIQGNFSFLMALNSLFIDILSGFGSDLSIFHCAYRDLHSPRHQLYATLAAPEVRDSAVLCLLFGRSAIL